MFLPPEKTFKKIILCHNSIHIKTTIHTHNPSHCKTKQVLAAIQYNSQNLSFYFMFFYIYVFYVFLFCRHSSCTLLKHHIHCTLILQAFLRLFDLLHFLLASWKRSRKVEPDFLHLKEYISVTGHHLLIVMIHLIVNHPAP